MTPEEFRAIRARLGLSLAGLGRAIGYAGKKRSTVHDYESGRRAPIPPWIARLLIMYDRHGVPEEWRNK